MKIMSFKDFILIYNLKNKATLNIKIQQIFLFLSLSDIGIYLRDGSLSSVVGIVNLHPAEGTPWVAYNDQKKIDSYGCSPPRKLSRFVIK